jgi:cation:H+ antiporter
VILGVSGIVTPLAVQSDTVWKEIPLSLGAAAVVLLLGNEFFIGSGAKVLSRWDGALLLMFFGLFLFYVYRQLFKEPSKQLATSASDFTNLKITVYIIGGLAGLMVGGRWVVIQAVSIAESLQVSEKVIGLTVVAAGTSLPELATSVIAAFKKKADIAVGNIVGSNIFNLFFILALSLLTSPISYDVAFNADLLFLIAGTAILFVTMFTRKHHRLDRPEALILLIIYLTYTGYLLLS